MGSIRIEINIFTLDINSYFNKNRNSIVFIYYSFYMRNW